MAEVNLDAVFGAHGPVRTAVASRRAALEATRDKLAHELDEAVGKDAATLSRELRLTLAELDSLPDAGRVATVDEIAKRRAARRAQA